MISKGLGHKKDPIVRIYYIAFERMTCGKAFDSTEVKILKKYDKTLRALNSAENKAIEKKTSY